MLNLLRYLLQKRPLKGVLKYGCSWKFNRKKVLNGKPLDSIVNYFTVNVSPQTTKTT